MQLTGSQRRCEGPEGSHASSVCLCEMTFPDMRTNEGTPEKAEPLGKAVRAWFLLAADVGLLGFPRMKEPWRRRRLCSDTAPGPALKRLSALGFV